MEDFCKMLIEFNGVSVALRLVLSCLIGGLIGLERGRHGRAAGLRTHVLVCIGACMTSMMSLYVVYQLGISGDVFRISAQVISGIGFLGAGTILVKNQSVVTGLTTAAGVWCTAAIGVALGYGFYEGALICAVIVIVTTTLLTLFEIQQKKLVRFYGELDSAAETSRAIRTICEAMPEVIKVDITAPKSGTSGAIGLLIVLNKLSDEENYLTVLNSIEHMIFAIAE